MYLAKICNSMFSEIYNDIIRVSHGFDSSQSFDLSELPAYSVIEIRNFNSMNFS